VNQTWLSRLTAVPKPLFALDVQRAGIPGQPGANISVRGMRSFLGMGLDEFKHRTVDVSNNHVGAGRGAGWTLKHRRSRGS
jgi:hypothetical protein